VTASIAVLDIVTKLTRTYFDPIRSKNIPSYFLIYAFLLMSLLQLNQEDMIDGKAAQIRRTTGVECLLSVGRPKCRWENYVTCTTWKKSRGSSGSIVSDYRLDDRGSIPTEAEDFSSNPCVQTGSGAHPASCPMDTGGLFPWGKARPGRDADHSPPSSAEVENEQELYLLSPQAPPWRVTGHLYHNMEI
jgi:hypothetical protein